MESYDEEFKKIVRPHFESGRKIRSLAEKFHVSVNGIICRIKKCREDCEKNPAAKEEYDLMKENEFLKKSGGILRGGNQSAAYRFTDENSETIGVRGLLKKFGFCPSAYYNYRKL